jgi:tetratricopeptide (TPR) repeat protein
MGQKTDSKEFAYEHGNSHHRAWSLGIRWLLTVFIVTTLLFFLKPFLVQQMLSRVSSYFSSYHFDDAIRMSKRIVVIDKKNMEAWNAVGYAYKQKAMIDKSVADYDKEKDDIDKSIKAYETVFSLDPKDIRVCFDIGLLYFSKREFAKAAEYFEHVRNMAVDSGESRAAGIFSYRGRSLTMLHRCYESLGDTAKAEQVQKELKQYIIK